MSTTGMAAVAAAAATTITQSQLDQAVAAARAEGHTEGHAAGLIAGEAKGRAAGADAERTRIIGIEAHAMPGHEKLIADCKADPNCTPDMAAARILGAEKALRAGHSAGIAAVEAVTGAVVAAPASQRSDGVQTPQEGVAKSAEAYKADWAKSSALQSDFATADAYANYAAGVASGRIRVLSTAPVVRAG